MSAEFEAKPNVARRSDVMHKTMRIDSSNDDDDTLEELAGSANNSIIGKVKSRVSSIIPSSFSKWFSPSTRSNDSLNGSFNVGTARRRRRLEIEDDEYVDDECDINEDGPMKHNDYKENLVNRSGYANKGSDEDDSDNSEDDTPREPAISSQRTQRTIKSAGGINQPPTKRSRISFDASNVNHQPLIASTPAIEVSRRNIYSSSLAEVAVSKPSNPHSLNYFADFNAYNQKNKKQPASYSFVPAPAMDVILNESFANKRNANEAEMETFSAISSRRTLHLPSTSQGAKERAASMENLSFKCQSESGIRDINKPNAAITEINNPTNTIEEEVYARDDVEEARIRQNAQFQVDAKQRRNNLNGNISLLSDSKKQKLNGTDELEMSNVDADSASESSEGCLGNISELPNIAMGQRKTGLFNMSNLKLQNGKKSRTPSFGNGINFYSHLEGRKSLFSGGANTGNSANALNNSTLSLTSLNRRQFNASIYGSTSALSDSRLLNTFSPFYKGKTTYGGAAAYKKYNVGSGPSGICSLTPTIIRPTSSLSTLSSSNNSINANTGGCNIIGGVGSNGTENTSAISSTAKRILDLINDFATPLSEAKKMANTNVKSNPQLLPQAKSRLNETDLQASRAIRLSQVRTPYARPAVTLQPTLRNSTLLPPVRELQVPSMSQLLQMKKMQSTTERSRQIAMQNSGSTTCRIAGGGAYTVPIINENNGASKDDSQTHQQQQPHTNKIKSKVRSSVRITASKNVTNTEINDSPPAVNLPHIAFPRMQSVPKFDIALPKPKAVPAVGNRNADTSTIDNLSKTKVTAEGDNVIGSRSGSMVLPNKSTFTFSTESKKIATTEHLKDTADFNGKDNKTVDPVAEINFQFSAPLTFACVRYNASSHQNNIADNKNYKFSPPRVVCFGDFGSEQSSPFQHKVQGVESVKTQLKSGSVLDALKQPFALPSTLKENAKNKEGIELIVGFGDQFKKAANNKWECETCLIRNENNVEKCIACETPRVKSSSTSTAVTTPLSTTVFASSSSFGAQFKKASDEWECEICMLRNNQQAERCVACESPRKDFTTSTKLSGSNWQPNSFGDAFKRKSNSWECPTCLINNNSDNNDCVACQTKNPNKSSGDSSVCNTAITKSTTYKFGFSSAENSTAPPDNGFKSLAAAQMSAKWECDACMTRNDAARNKCVCCEQAKPGTSTPDIPSNGAKFMFGAAASSKFTFGFGSTANETPKLDSDSMTTSVVAIDQKTDRGISKGFVFGNSTNVTPSTAGGNNFSFGIKPSPASTENKVASKGKDGDSKDVADNRNGSTQEISQAKTNAFKFGSATVSSGNDLVTIDPTMNFKFGVSSNDGLAKANTTAESTTPVADAKGSTTKLSEPTAVASNGKTATVGFVFGNASTQQAATTSGFSFGAPVIATSSEAKTTKKSTFAFGVSATTQPSQESTTSSTTSTATIKPMFSFGSNTISTKPTASALASAISTKSSTTASAFTQPAGGFGFDSNTTGITNASTTAKPIFGSYATPAAISVAPSSAVAPVPSTTMSTLSTMPTNVFGTFGEGTSSAKTTTTSATATLASTAILSATNANPFGTLSHGAALSVAGESKPTASATMIFGSASNKSAATAQATPAPFVFGSSTANVAAQGTVSGTAAIGNMVAPSTSWPKGGFAFSASNASAGTSNTNETPKPLFGSFVSTVAPAAAASVAPTTIGAGSSIFGNAATSGGSATFGSVAANTSTVNSANIFGAAASATTSVTQTTPNVFDGVPAAPTSFGAPALFGSSSSNTSNSTPTFAAASSATFGSFAAAATSTSGDGAPAPKKSEPAFNFGGSSSQNAPSGGFNFGTNTTTKPAFNFTASNTPTFNFTGSNSDAAKPFQFGATPSAPVFNFNIGAVEATPSAPFQFNAGAAPASSNIFAPTPSAPNAPGTMQARRKIRQPTRRLTPR